MSIDDKNVVYENIAMDTEETIIEEMVTEEEFKIDPNINLIKTERVDSFKKKIDYEDDATKPESVFIGVKQEWSTEVEAPVKNLDSMDSDDERTEFYIEKETDVDEEEEDDGEETIAMFVTASGQQLALYAVEDSDDYFAVAVYDESGEPPSNFQFLMKSDVERLIREGAVRTVKKPTQIKKQLVASQPPVFAQKDEIIEDIKPSGNQLETNCRIVDKRSKISANNVKPVIADHPASKIIRLEDSGSEDELVEQSTVQYILCDGDQSDTELTFDEIQATLQGLKTNNVEKHHKNICIEKPEHKKSNNGLLYITSPPIRNTSYRTCYSNPVKFEPPSPAPSPVKRSHISNTSIIGSKQNHGVKRELSPISDYYTPNTSANLSLSESLTNTNSQSKVKRPRKQQLTSVNRGDSEIIIQPASMLEEEEEIPIPRKKGRRKKKHDKVSKLPTRKSTRRRRTRVEIIDLDIDDDDSDEVSSRKEILEITLDENKEKGSSDKENEVIMVGDSDDEEEESSKAAALKCKHCSKMFKQRRAFDSHIRICGKLRGRSRRLSDRLSTDESDSEDESPRYKKINKSQSSKGKHSKEKGSKPKKEYTCKTCEEKFDMVVSLARHVRAEHSPRKRGRPSKADSKKMKLQELVRIKNQQKRNAEERSKRKYEEDDDDEDEDTSEDEIHSKEPEYSSEEETVSKKPEKSKCLEKLDEEKLAEEKLDEEKLDEEKLDEEKLDEIVSKESEEPEKVEENEKETVEHPKELNLKKTEKSCENDSLKLREDTQPRKQLDKKKLMDLHRKWKFEELICTVCNRWFPSASAHETHSLRHFTKRSLGIFKSRNKLLKSQFMYMKNKKLNAKAEKSLQSEESENLKKTQSEEETTDKTSAIRRRGRPRKNP